MTLTASHTADGVAARTNLDGIALKPTECDVSVAADLPVDLVCLDYEGREALPDTETLAALAEEVDLRVTTPVRADGFDPRGDDSLVATLPDAAERVLVAGHGAYLTDDERSRAIAPRLGDAAAAVRSAGGTPWVGTEGIERVALAAGGVQYDLLSRTTERDVRALRAAGFDGEVALYAPVVPSDDEDEILDAVGGYAARRKPVREALPEDAATDAAATGRAREVLSAAVRDFAIVGDPEAVGERVRELKGLGVDHVVGYPAAGVDTLR
ncbi:LLM class flavin-dependent oxidoreductase [Halobaculum sp. CBA1158]|uniref:LLM class flavin-dependent oxidoreductase n=1 Tax=Halobaculum sp. CBA1158 TaxID=2904243 RepID=UPI001F1F7EF6|nr:LLM class flavin-dependent oxidoreductase [Halobaculum sp. CBA1158]UIP00920.1 LLM class flavin-dependent oxidoreductase [Halobaculum sp. CBA1158]